MAYDQHIADRISQFLLAKKAPFETKKMMGGLCFMVDGKMACGIHYDKKKKVDLLMARVGAERYEELLHKEHAMPMDFTGRSMKGYIFVAAEGYDSDKDLAFWMEQILAFNPFAKASKKRKKK